MKGAIGSILLLWVGIERAVRNLVPDAPGAAGHFFNTSAGLDAWLRGVAEGVSVAPFRYALALCLRQRLLEARKVRNGICHGLCGLDGANSERSGRIIWELDGAETSLTWPEVNEHLAWLSKVTGALAILAAADLPPRGRLIDTAENRDWWRAEYGTDLEAG
jgi:hypothetical protein